MTKSAATPRPGDPAATGPALAVPRFAKPVAPDRAAAPPPAPTPTPASTPPGHALAQGDSRGARAVDAGLRRRCWLVDDPQGRVALAGPALALGDAIDAEAAALFVRHFGTRAVDLPTLLVEGGAWPGRSDQAEAAAGGPPAGKPPGLPLDDRIATAACAASATLLRGQPLGGQGEALTWRGRVLWPPGSGAEALSEARLRALVLIGTAEQVAIGGARLPALIAALAASFDLPCRIRNHRPAEAPCQPQTIELAAQPRGELAAGGAPRLLVGGAIRAPARGSDPRLDLTTSDGCPATIVWLGLTLESWVRAAFGQHGFEPGGWPARVRARVFA